MHIFLIGGSSLLAYGIEIQWDSSDLGRNKLARIHRVCVLPPGSQYHNRFPHNLRYRQRPLHSRSLHCICIRGTDAMPVQISRPNDTLCRHRNTLANWQSRFRL